MTQAQHHLPPSTDTRHRRAPDWYPEDGGTGAGTEQLRWWDGERWTDWVWGPPLGVVPCVPAVDPSADLWLARVGCVSSATAWLALVAWWIVEIATRSTSLGGAVIIVSSLFGLVGMSLCWPVVKRTRRATGPGGDGARLAHRWASVGLLLAWVGPAFGLFVLLAVMDLRGIVLE